MMIMMKRAFRVEVRLRDETRDFSSHFHTCAPRSPPYYLQSYNISHNGKPIWTSICHKPCTCWVTLPRAIRGVQYIERKLSTIDISPLSINYFHKRRSIRPVHYRLRGSKGIFFKIGLRLLIFGRIFMNFFVLV